MPRQPLPQRRRSVTAKGRWNGTAFFVNVGFYDDGRPGEVFIDIAKAGTQMRTSCHALAMMISHSLQRGAPFSEICNSIGDFSPDDIVSAIVVVLREAVDASAIQSSDLSDGCSDVEGHDAVNV